jgi:tRNA(fMet)-specific endonuclease VapC
MKYLLGINVISECLKQTPDTAVLDKLQFYQDEVCLAAPVWHELLFGCRRLPKSKKRKVIEGFLSEAVKPNIPILPYDVVAAGWHADQRANLITKGITPSFVDGQIASIAYVNDLIG